ncbi:MULTISPECIES: Fe-S-containing hydro-lyase [Anaerofustis]|uniref:Fe-S-containing hydro-lyase n=1 Tax=Anaerofustis TaxID=264995 RepID=UPI0011068406|nr:MULTISPECIES: Fe-S-containing hydro-lyase [Anaerofustis]MCO8193938.1 Fe-S-containing hydro-lyase [Anaerofustis sp. NSJ-163]
MEKKVKLPLSDDEIMDINAGDKLYLTGYIYTARDAAHKKMVETMENGDKLPFNIKGECIYYAGPCPEKPGEVIGSCGPTTSARMDKYTPFLLERGLKLIIGKGERNDEVEKSLKDNNALYLAAVGGCGALIKKCIKEAELIAYPELLSEAVRKLYVEDFPVIVAIDSKGNNLYKTEKEKYKRPF